MNQKVSIKEILLALVVVVILIAVIPGRLSMLGGIQLFKIMPAWLP